MNAPANSLAIVNAAGQVVTFVRSDVPAGWQPPIGCTAVPAAQLAAVWEFAPAVPVPVPQSLTPRQLRQQLIQSGLMPQIEAAFDGIVDPTERALALNWWEYADEILRSHPLVAKMGAAVGLTPEQIDAAFIAAAQL